MAKKLSIGNIIGFVVGGILMIPTDPVTVTLGLAIVTFNAYKLGWLGGPR